MMNFIGVNKTKILGIGSLLTLLGAALTAIANGDIASINVPELMLAISTVMSSLGVAFARPNNVTSLEAGALKAASKRAQS